MQKASSRLERGLLALLVLTGCSDPQPATNPADSRFDSAASAATQPLAGDTVIAARAVIFMHATPQDFEALRAHYSEEDYATVADDAMYYRATAHEYLEKLRLPVRDVDGKRPFTFRVTGSPRTIDFSKDGRLDVIVLYEPEREPRVIGTVDIDAATEYFGITSSQE